MTAATTQTTTETIEVPGAVLTYDVRRNPTSDAPVLLMIGSPMGAAGFGTLAGHFADRTVVTYDPRGVERSRRTDGAATTTPDEHADDLSRLITALDAGPVDLFASSGGAINALALVARHPEQVRTLIAHEPPTAALVPDHEFALAACQDIHDTYLRSGMGPAMAKFIAIVSHKGQIGPDYLEQPAPDPAMFGLPTEDDGSRDDVLLGQNLVSCTHYEPDVEALRVGVDPHRRGCRRGLGRRTGTSWRAGRSRAARDDGGRLPGRPRRLPRRGVRPDGRTGGVRGPSARGARRRGVAADAVSALRPGAARTPAPPGRTTAAIPRRRSRRAGRGGRWPPGTRGRAGRSGPT